MFKNTLLIILLIVNTSCGYDATYSKKNRLQNLEILIGQISFEGDRDVNIKIKQKLTNYTRGKKYEEITGTNFIETIKIKSDTSRTVISRDSKGDVTVYSMEVIVFAKAIKENLIIADLELVKTFKYDNNIDRFILNERERDIKKSLAETITNEIVSTLSSIQ